MIIFDAHVHIYDCFDQSVLFDRAYVNFFQQASLLQKEPHFCGILLLAEKSDQKYFKRFQKKIGLEDRVEVGRWLITKTDEPNVLQAATLSGEQLFLIEGKQYNSIEGLEVLSLFQDSGELKDLTLKKLVSTIIEKKGLPVIPWAFGKWIGKRGQILKSLLLQLPAQRRLFLGDNGGRPSCYVPKPLLNTNFKKLPGSDPLPLENEEKRIGAFGAHIDEAPDYTGIGKQLLTLLQQDVVQISPYGRGLSLPRFLINQFQIRR